ncbi:hypothetical protein A2715_02015 [Candidatus Woesebacteria bacterium RIFCSPHIGHO2_01_FULL_39_32]|uniref:Uncharacterized protein n=2 Tax=Candidatus Woeseibacteriota TaxID=1752722 RepID=A0A0G0S7P9_9BACT|nr:MAG: hypothetical protein UT61_C0002G0009 [Candidatus Woesebacteria bacterium GW2011_GWA1_39_8]OGM03438.1 MAG: hypothetical protein A2124_02250 [Candidatus Woesebacteria bacterium GWB1_37_5]OGM23933.1 MAG: hypothetical protein A2715_02015 [Candidatus Woesebacteria bacterium RIFCSPHIGHO2_01_FULL_39_32]OGM37439.1 MAG: hypothetical protein A3F01_03250 [Candidatus Woesebacteria bacterium RIFCSPHIGHO2_12_FULL_38_11]OGM64122.1 MAG: hypothetical protein A2893_03255 [Candidatus Woesebacteria bacteri
MQLTENGKVYALILLASAIFSIFTIAFGFFPYLGASISFIAFTLLAYYIKKDKTRLTKIFFAITLILSVFLSIRSEGFLTLLNIVGIFYFGSLFTLTLKGNKTESTFSIIFAPFTLFLKSLFTTKEYSLEFNDSLTEEKKKENTLNTIAITLVTIIALAIILPLLASANPYFEKLLSDLVDLLGIRNFKITENLFEWTLRLIFFIVLVLFVPKMATLMNKNEASKLRPQEGLNMLIPKIAVAVVLIIFFITQLQLYFSSPETLESLGYTYSQYTNEVFAQLSAVAVIVLALLYFEKENKKANINMALVLAFQGIFLTLMAYKSVYEYSNAWGFTYKRLYGFTVATWILGVFTIYLYAFLKNLKREGFIFSSVIYTGIILILVNLSNFDYMIYHFRKASTGQGIDHGYLTRLSSDSLSYKNQLSEIAKDSPQILTDLDKKEANTKGLWTLLYKIERLQEKYKDADIRGFNLFEYLQYKDIKDIDTQIYRDKYK